MHALHVYCNTAVKGLTYTNDPEGVQHPRESADISVKPLARPCYKIYVTLSLVMYSIAPNYQW